jgi:trimethylguanosine synthase
MLTNIKNLKNSSKTYVVTAIIIVKYWLQRQTLFHRFKNGVKMDFESFFSVTSEEIAAHQARRCHCEIVLDAFCGAGGNTIQFARYVEQVIACDSNNIRLGLARHNAYMYGVYSRIEFFIGNFFELNTSFLADVVFLSPPWGGPNYSDKNFYNLDFDLASMCNGKGLREILREANKALRFPFNHYGNLKSHKSLNYCATFGLILFLPKNLDMKQLVGICLEEFPEILNCNSGIEVEHNFFKGKLKAFTIYLGFFPKLIQLNRTHN